ncbi:MAG TPA: ATPase, T2SS/T4P/T4SS family [Kofleriaceae bacterium]
MPKLDVYLKSIERFGAAGAVLASNQAVTLRFPAGDRQATQVTPHDQLIALVREVAPPAALAAIDQGRPARFDYETWTVAVAPKPNAWQVTIEPASPASAAAPAPPAGGGGVVDLAIERGQYDSGAVRAAVATASGSPLLDQLTSAARALRATDIYLAAGAAPMLRVAGELRASGDPLDAEALSRELGQVAPGDARAAWTELGAATFTYSDAVGRVRTTLARDHRGPSAALRLLVGEPVGLDRIGAPREVAGWLERRGLVAVAGAPGSGKTTFVSALLAALGERRIVAIADAIEIVHASPWISQRAIGPHVATAAAGIAAAMLEGADAIAVDARLGPESAERLVDAAAAGHLVIAVVASATAAAAGARLAELVGPERRAALQQGFLGAVAAVVKPGGRTFEIAAI